MWAILPIVRAEYRRRRTFAEHRDRRRRRRLGIVEEAAVDDVEVGDRRVGRADPVEDRRIALRLGQQLRRREPLARGGGADSFEVRLNHAEVLEAQALRELADLLQRLLVRCLARLDDQIAYAELLDERHDLLLGAGADRQRVAADRGDTRAAHRGGDDDAGRAGAFDLRPVARSVGSTRAISAFSWSPSSTTRLSVRWVTLTSRSSKRSPTFRKTWFLPALAKTACRGA